ncbi:VanZ family protein [Eubacterium oxidoreducens]|nr:VanZ family protein [Eubacterium oxidoreducens]
MAVIKITIFPLVMIGLPSNITESINLIPFHNGFGRTDVLNFLMTLPFGMILPFVTKSKTIKSVSIKGFMLGCLVEILQLLEILFTDGFSVKIVDVNDVIFNLGGTVAGYLVMCLVSKLIDRPSKKGRVFMKYVFDVLDGVKLV